MDYMYIDGHKVPIEGEKNILAVIRKAGIELPTFCYHSELSTYGACRMCVVENEWGKVIASCSEHPKAGMKVFTNTPKIQKHRKMILELLLASHCRDCTLCEKNGRCTLQTLASRFGIKKVRFADTREHLELDESSPSIVRDPNKCILCGDCVRACEELQGMGIIDFVNRGSNLRVSPAFDKKISETNCIGCGQCRVVCPTGAIVIKNETVKVWNLLADKQKRVVVQIAPAVRVALGEEFGLPAGENSAGKIVAALRKLGFDEVYDTALGADLTVMEESKELVNRLNDGNEHDMPMFTSCCPGWFKYAHDAHPELAEDISTCRSPMQMFSAVLKEHFDSMKAVDGLDTAVVAIMPCTAKKGEILRPDCQTEGRQDTDVVLTTQELSSMIKEAGIQFNELEAQAADMPFGLVSGAGVLFGVTGGVTEAVLRKIAADKTQDALEDIAYTGVRGMEGVKEAAVMIGEREVKIAVVNGLKNAQLLIEKIKNKEVRYDFVEVMACGSGCIGGGGQPVSQDRDLKLKRSAGIYTADANSQIKRSEENPMMISLYGGILRGKVHKLLHGDRK